MSAPDAEPTQEQKHEKVWHRTDRPIAGPGYSCSCGKPWPCTDGPFPIATTPENIETLCRILADRTAERDSERAARIAAEKDRDEADAAIDCKNPLVCLTPEDPCWTHAFGSLFRSGDSERAARLKLEEALRNLTMKLIEIAADEHFKGIFTVAAIHGVNYRGPNWSEELKAAHSLLTPTPNAPETWAEHALSSDETNCRCGHPWPCPKAPQEPPSPFPLPDGRFVRGKTTNTCLTQHVAAPPKVPEEPK